MVYSGGLYLSVLDMIIEWEVDRPLDENVPFSFTCTYLSLSTCDTSTFKMKTCPIFQALYPTVFLRWLLASRFILFDQKACT